MFCDSAALNAFKSRGRIKKEKDIWKDLKFISVMPTRHYFPSTHDQFMEVVAQVIGVPQTKAVA